MINSILLIGLGGGLGSIARFLCQQYFTTAQPGAFPWGTFWVNLAGCLLIGLGWGFFMKNPSIHQQWRHLFMTGLCGGFTTFSAFSLESLNLLDQEKIVLFLLYIFGTVALGLLATFIGIRIFQL